MLIFLSLSDLGFLDLMWLMGLAFKGQDPPQGPLKYIQLIPDSAERHFAPPQLNCSKISRGTTRFKSTQVMVLVVDRQGGLTVLAVTKALK
jgi:hypothetical protein